MSDTEYAKVIAKNLKRIMYVNEKTQADLARDLKISKATISSWMNGTRIPRMDKIDLLCHYFNVARTDIMEEAGHNSHVESVRIPVLGRVSAGLPMEAVENIIDYEEIPAEMTRHGDYFCLVIHGDSMEPRMYEGDVIVVKKQNTANPGDIVIATINGDDAVCKRLAYYSRSIGLLSLNSKYDPIIIADDEKEKPVTIWGVVVEIRGKLKGI